MFLPLCLSTPARACEGAKAVKPFVNTLRAANGRIGEKERLHFRPILPIFMIFTS